MKTVIVAVLGIAALCGFLYAQAGSSESSGDMSSGMGAGGMKSATSGGMGAMDAADKMKRDGMGMMDMMDPEMQGMHDCMMFQKHLQMGHSMDAETLDLYSRVFKGQEKVMDAARKRLSSMEELVSAMQKGDQDTIGKARDNLRVANEEVMDAWKAGKMDRTELRNKLGKMMKEGMKDGGWGRGMGAGRMKMGTAGGSWTGSGGAGGMGTGK